jgi:30S ribosomal protein S31
MGKGDKRSRRGKIFAGSYGNTRPKKKKVAAPAVEEKAVKKKKTK